MEYTVTVHEKTSEYLRVTILETTYTLQKYENAWHVADYDECPVSDKAEKRVKRILKAFNII